jgi:hypothetical protein
LALGRIQEGADSIHVPQEPLGFVALLDHFVVAVNVGPLKLLLTRGHKLRGTLKSSENRSLLWVVGVKGASIGTKRSNLATVHSEGLRGLRVNKEFSGQGPVVPLGLGAAVKLRDALLGSNALSLEDALLVEPALVLCPRLCQGSLSFLASQDQGAASADALAKGVTGEYPGAEAEKGLAQGHSPGRGHRLGVLRVHLGLRGL